MTKHIQNFRGIENLKKNCSGHQKRPKTLVAHQNYKQIEYYEAFLDNRKKKNILQIASIFILLIQNIVFSALNL